MGIALTGGGGVDNSGVIAGGTGGAGGLLVNGRAGGNGGAGVLLTSGGTVLNTGAIQGGAGGGARRPISALPSAGGSGVVATGNVVINNAGSISGGLGGNNATRANAIDLSGGNNALVLQAGYSFTGNVVSTSGATNGVDTLMLGGDATPSAAFNVSNIVATLPASFTGTQYVGFANLTKAGTSTWQLTGNGSAGQNWSIADGTLQGDANTFAGNITFVPPSVEANPGVVFNQDSGNANSPATAGYAGSISGVGALTKIGDGTLRLSGNSTYIGTTTISGGTLALIGTASIAASRAVIVDGNLDISGSLRATLTSLAGSGTVTLGARTLTLSNANGSFAGVIGGTGGLTLSRGRQTLSGVNTYSGGTTISSGTLAGGAGSFGSGAIVNNAALLVDQASDAALVNTILGSGSLTKSGAGRLTLTGINSYTGSTIFNAGAVSVSDNANLGDAAGGLVFNGGTLQTTADLTMNRATTLGGQGSTIDTLVGTALAHQGAIGGAGGLTKTGAGTLVVTGANSYAGGTAFNAGVVSVSRDANLGDAAGGLRFDGGTLQTTADLTMNRATTLDAQGGTIDTLAGTTLTHQGVIGGAGPLTKTGDGTLTLADANTYAGGTTISAGTLAGSVGSFGSGTIINNATLLIDQSGDGTLANTIDGSGGLTKTGVGLLTLTGVNTYAGGTTINAGTVAGSAASFGSGAITNNAALFIDQIGDTTLAASLSGSGALTKSGLGTLTLTGVNTYTGGTTISGGTVSIASDQNLGAAPGLLKLDGGTLRTTAAFTTARSVDLGAGGGTLQADADLTVSGVVGGAGALTKTGAGTLTLTGANSYTGGTGFNAGVVSVSDNANLGDAAGGLVFNGGTLRTTADLAMNRATTFDVQGGVIDTLAGTTLTHQGVIGGAGALTKSGTGKLTVTGTNAYAGGTTISAGTLAGSAASFGSGAFANNAALRIDQPDDATLANTVSGSGVVTKTGAGTLTLSGENSYSGGTDLKEGGVAVRNSRALGTGELAMHEGTTLRFAVDGLTLANAIAFTDAVDPIVDTGPFTATLTGAITGPGDLSKIGSGTLILSGANTYTGATAVTEGTLRAGVPNTFSPASAHSVASGATLDLAGFSQSIAALTNAGTVSLIGATPGTSLYGELGKLWASGGDTRVKSQLNASTGLRVRW